MTTATEKDVQVFRREFVYEVEPNLACFHNALFAGMLVYEQEGRIPRIWSVSFPDDHHAYLVHHGRVYNSGVTWPDHTYPDFTLEELKKRGTDETRSVLHKALVAFHTEPAHIRDKETVGFLAVGKIIAQHLRLYEKYMKRLKRMGHSVQTRDEYYASLLLFANMEELHMSKEEILRSLR